MTMTTAQKVAAIAALVEGTTYPGYSGRCMYGRTCWGVVCEHDQVKRAAASGKRRGLGAASSDNMGYQAIVYWPDAPPDPEPVRTQEPVGPAEASMEAMWDDSPASQREDFLKDVWQGWRDDRQFQDKIRRMAQLPWAGIERNCRLSLIDLADKKAEERKQAREQAALELTVAGDAQGPRPTPPPPAPDAPTAVVHDYLCHPDGEPCPDGCDVVADPERLATYQDNPAWVPVDLARTDAQEEAAWMAARDQEKAADLGSQAQAALAAKKPGACMGCANSCASCEPALQALEATKPWVAFRARERDEQINRKVGVEPVTVVACTGCQMTTRMGYATTMVDREGQIWCKGCYESSLTAEERGEPALEPTLPMPEVVQGLHVVTSELILSTRPGTMSGMLALLDRGAIYRGRDRYIVGRVDWDRWTQSWERGWSDSAYCYTLRAALVAFEERCKSYGVVLPATVVK